MATAELKSSFAQFVAFARGLKGDEKSEAQPFLDHFLRALGYDGVIEAGATYEFRVAKKPGSAQLELLRGPEAAYARSGEEFDHYNFRLSRPHSCLTISTWPYPCCQGLKIRSSDAHSKPS